jgi:hypothetical protein
MIQINLIYDIAQPAYVTKMPRKQVTASTPGSSRVLGSSVPSCSLSGMTTTLNASMKTVSPQIAIVRPKKMRRGSETPTPKKIHMTLMSRIEMGTTAAICECECAHNRVIGVAADPRGGEGGCGVSLKLD